MDKKEALLKRIQGIDMPDESKKVIVDYIGAHEFNDDLVENVAKMLETMGDAADLAAEHVSDTMEALENLRNDFDEAGETYLDETAQAADKYQEEVAGVFDEVEKDLASTTTDMPVTPTAELPVTPVVPVDSAPAESPLQEVPMTPVVENPTSTESLTPSEPVSPQMPWQQNPTGQM
ncbi:MAG TPA: hypothetical protein VF837_04810 [Patescibacteria group bacterium]